MIKKILIDHGHGGLIEGEYQTKGKRATHNKKTLFEGACNRAQAHLLNYMLSLEGIKSEIIAPENEDTSLRARVMRVNKIVAKKPEEYLLISIHSNAFHNKDVRGWEIWTSLGETFSDDYAIPFHDRFVEAFEHVPIRKSVSGVDKDGKFRIVMSTKCPALLIEDLFMTNPDDFKLLTSFDEIGHLVEYKVNAIKDIMGLTKKKEAA